METVTRERHFPKFLCRNGQQQIESIVRQVQVRTIAFGMLWDCSSGLVCIPQTWPAAMTSAVRLPARSQLTPQGANRQGPVAGPSTPKGNRDELGVATVLFAAIWTVQWLRVSVCQRAVPSHLCTADSRRICDYTVYPGACCGTLS